MAEPTLLQHPTHQGSPSRQEASEPLTLPLVSIIVISFNHAPFLPKCLDSILKQTYPRLQIITVDNASTDGSAQAVQQFIDRHGPLSGERTIETVFSDTNGREMGAMLMGFAKTRGRYVIYVDGDDWLLPQCVETHIKTHLVSRVAVGLTSVDMYQSAGDEIVVGSGRQVSDYVMSKRGQQTDFCRLENLDAFDFPPSPPGGEFKLSDLHLVTPAQGHEWYWSQSSGLCFRREALELIFNPTPIILDAGDSYLVRAVCCLTGGITIDRSLAVYRVHTDNYFARHPALENILYYARAHCDEINRNVSEAVLHCFREQMATLAQRLEFVDIYIGAIHSLAIVSLNEKANGYSSYTMRFLIENKKAIEEHFGKDVYDRWLRKYASLKERIALTLGRQPQGA